MKIKEIATSEQQKADAKEYYFIFHIMHLDGVNGLGLGMCAQCQFAIKMHTFIHVQQLADNREGRKKAIAISFSCSSLLKQKYNIRFRIRKANRCSNSAALVDLFSFRWCFLSLFSSIPQLVRRFFRARCFIRLFPE